MYKQYYSRFLSADPERLHFAAHSHHLWPDVTRDAMTQFWDDSARLADKKWEHIFTEVVPEAQRHISEIIGINTPEQICFAPNTHEFIMRLLSCFLADKRLRILTTDSEFYSFERQMKRLEEEENLVDVTRIPAQPFNSFSERFSEAASKEHFDLIFVSQVFYNSGFVNRDPGQLFSKVKSDDTFIVLDSYHGFCAIPTDISAIQDRVFYLSGGYKYAMSGEGVCFLAVPKGIELRPKNTGWFAAFESRAEKQKGVHYATNGQQFAGATFDSAAIYRFNSVMRLWKKLGLNVSSIHAYVQELQRYFLHSLDSKRLGFLSTDKILHQDLEAQGHFFTFIDERAPLISAELMEKNIITDARGNNLRFGFGLYQEKSDIDALFDRLSG